MRVAIIADIHSNRVALTTVLEHIQRSSVDRIICGGDLATLGPEPAAVIDILREHGIPCLKGNHDAFLVDPELILSYTPSPVVRGAVDWSRDQLGPEHLAYLASLPPTLSVPLESGQELLITHGSPRSYLDDILATTPAEEVDLMIQGHEAPVLAAAHTHIQMLRQHRGRWIMNPGSVGMPFREYAAGARPFVMPHAEYAVLESGTQGIQVTLHRLDLDRDALRRAVEDDGNPLNPMLRQQYSR